MNTNGIADLKAFKGNQVLRRDKRICLLSGKILTLPLNLQIDLCIWLSGLLRFLTKMEYVQECVLASCRTNRVVISTLNDANQLYLFMRKYLDLLLLTPNPTQTFDPTPNCESDMLAIRLKFPVDLLASYRLVIMLKLRVTKISPRNISP